MAFPYSGSSGNAETVAGQIDDLIGSAVAQALAWRQSIEASPTIVSEQARAVYQALLGLRAYVEDRKGIGGLAEAYERRFSGLSGFDPGAEWEAGRLAIEQFAAWFQANWPKRVTGTGEPAFSQFGAADGQLTSFTISLSSPARTALVEKLNAVLGAFAAQA